MKRISGIAVIAAAMLAAVTAQAADAEGYEVTQNSINYANNSGICAITADYGVKTGESDTLIGCLAYYDGDGILKGVRAKAITPDEGSAEFSVRMALDIEDVKSGARVKSMLWRLDDMKPVTDAAEKTITNNGSTSGNFADAGNIRLAEDSLFEESAKVGLDYIKGVSVDSLLAPSFEMHGLTPPNGAQRYGGWERKSANSWVSGGGAATYTLAGHSLGHWLSAAAVMYRETGDAEILEMLNYAVEQLDYLQTESNSPYIGGVPEDTFTKMFAGDSKWADNYWVPWYGIHKIYQGLLDAYYYAENEAALKVVTKFADWAVYGTANLSDSFMQQTLGVEYGGMNEIFALMYEITGESKYLDTARRFTHDAILNPLIDGVDALSGMHANTQIPKIIGAAELYEQDPVKYADYRTACENFWDYVINDRSYVIGGNAIAEHFEAKGAETLGVKTCESCNTYNMMRLAEHLYSWTYDSKYIDWYETALYNHILGQQEPETGAKMYFVSLLQGHHRIYEDKYNSWWCCTGTGMENPGRYTRAVYYEDGDNLYVNLYLATQYLWESKGLRFKVETNYPYEDKVKITVTEGSADAVLKFRAPSWLAADMSAVVNSGDAFTEIEDGYLTLAGSWNTGDVIELTLPMDVAVYRSRSNGQIAYKYGPVVLAAELDSVEGVAGVSEYVSNETKLDSVARPVPYILSEGAELDSFVTRTSDKELTFEIDASHSSDEKAIALKPFYEIHHNFHNVYWDVDKPTGEYDKALNAVTVDKVQPDGQQDEIGHQLESKNSHNGSLVDNLTNTTYFWRDAYGSDDAYFEYTLEVDEDTKYLFVRYWGVDGPFTADGVSYTRDFNIYIDGELLGNQQINGNSDSTYDVFYPIPETMIDGKASVVVKFAPKSENTCAGGVLEIRTMRDEVGAPERRKETISATSEKANNWIYVGQFDNARNIIGNSAISFSASTAKPSGNVSGNNLAYSFEKVDATEANYNKMFATNVFLPWAARSYPSETASTVSLGTLNADTVYIYAWVSDACTVTVTSTYIN